MIESVISQSYTEWELIIVDDCSTDDTVNIVERYLNADDRIKLIKQEQNNGPAIARNIAIDVADGRYIAFLDSDDIWLPLKLEKQIKFMQDNSYSFTYCSYDRIDVTGKYTSTKKAPTTLSYHELLKSCPIGCLTVVYDTHFFGKVFMPNIRKRQDYCLWLELLKITDFAYGLSDVLAKYRVHDKSISYNKASAAWYQWRVYREIEKLSLVKSLYYFVCYAKNGLFKRR